MISAGGPSVLPLTGFLVFYVIQRAAELALSARNARALLARGGIEHGRSHFPWLVALHTLFPLALVTEVLALHARPGRLAPLWFAAWLAAQVLRFASMRALGPRWTARVIVVPGEPPVRLGLYRWLKHPNYLAVVAELLAAPLMLGAWRTAAVISLANLPALWVRIRCEDRALVGMAPVAHGG
jgi:methyltransferase